MQFRQKSPLKNSENIQSPKVSIFLFNLSSNKVLFYSFSNYSKLSLNKNKNSPFENLNDIVKNIINVKIKIACVIYR